MSTWEIEHWANSAGTGTSDRRTLAAWGFAALDLEQRNWARGELVLTVATGTAFLADPLFAFEDKIVLWRDGARVWHGWHISPYRSLTAPAESITYQFADAWYWLEKYTYDPDYVENLALSVHDQIDDALGSAQVSGAPILRGTLALLMPAPAQQETNLTCAARVQSASRYEPNSAGWWDPSGEVPVFTAARRASLPTHDHALSAPTEAVGIGPMYDRQVASVRIRYRYGPYETDYYDDYAHNTGHPDYARALMIYVASPDQDQADAAKDADIASELLDALKDLSWAGKLDLHETSAPLPWYLPGAALNLTGGRTEWETAGATVQTVAHHVGAESTDTCAITLGAPEHLGLQDWMELSDIAYTSADVTGDPGGQDPAPAPYEPATEGALDFEELTNSWTQFPALLGGPEFASLEGNAVIVGHPEMTPTDNSGVSDPPKRYRIMSGSGVIASATWYGCDCGGDGCPWGKDTDEVHTYSGQSVYNRDTGVRTGSVDVVWVDTGPACPGTGTTHSSSPPAAPTGIDLTETRTRTLTTYSYSGECGSAGANCIRLAGVKRQSTGTATITLSGEDTEADAIYRLLLDATWSAWDATAVTAAYQVRSVGLSFFYRAIQYRGNWTNARPWWSYRADVLIQTRLYGSTDENAWGGDETITQVIQSTAAGVLVLPEALVECAAGYERRIASITLSPDA